MHRSEGEAYYGDDTERDSNSHEDTEKTGNSEIEPNVQGVEPPQHDDGVEEHDDVAVVAVEHLPKYVENCFVISVTETILGVWHSDEVIRTEIKNQLNELLFPSK